MKESVTKTGYDYAVDYMKIITAIYDAIVEYKIREVIIIINDKVKWSFVILSRLDSKQVIYSVDDLCGETDDIPELEEIKKPLEPGVLEIHFTV